MTKLVVVESPSKAKTINKYLGSQYKVLASFGHVRDLSTKVGSVKPDQNFAMVWALSPSGKKRMSAIEAALRNCDTLYLSTDPDREGEAISWHLQSILNERKQLTGKKVLRATFGEITKEGVSHGINNPRQIDFPLVDAYLARRALDYLVGYTLSPVLWSKLPGAKSAGRVQSVALRLLCDRDHEIETFEGKAYWTIKALLSDVEGNNPFEAQLGKLKGKKIEKFTFKTPEEANEAKGLVSSADLHVSKIARSKGRRNPQPPFTTSALQQDASKKLKMKTKKTMEITQQLFEGIDVGDGPVGLITYMRTDGINMAQEAVEEIRGYLGKKFGDKYLPSVARTYKSKVKNAQEAHEAIRPTSVWRVPDEIKDKLSRDQYRLYKLIWDRAVSSQMPSAEFDKVAMEVENPDKSMMLKANGSMMTFDGFLSLYNDGGDDKNKLLPPLKEGDSLKVRKVTNDRSLTKPPARFTEAGLIKKLEELGVGRPSTYASIISVIQDRGYCTLGKNFIPTPKGRIVVAFLESFFAKYVDTGFTADLENQLDDISAGDESWKKFLKSFWDIFYKTIGEAQTADIAKVSGALTDKLDAFLFPLVRGDRRKNCPKCHENSLKMSLDQRGVFISCSNQACDYINLILENDHFTGAVLGKSAKGLDISVKKGKFGAYVEEAPVDDNAKPRRASLPNGMKMDQITLEQAEELLALPRTLGKYPKTGEEISTNNGKYGPYVKVGSVFANIDNGKTPLTITLDEAIALLDKKTAGRNVLGKSDGKDVELRKGPYGHYVKCGSDMVSVPKGVKPENVTLKLALGYIEDKKKFSKNKPKKKQYKPRQRTLKRKRSLSRHR